MRVRSTPATIGQASAGKPFRAVFPSECRAATTLQSAGSSLGRMDGHRGSILWLTGLPGAGKSTIAFELACLLGQQGLRVQVLDSRAGYAEDVNRFGETAALLAQAGTIAICACVSPSRAGRERLRTRHRVYFHEVYVNAPPAVCAARGFAAAWAPYEAPLEPEVEILSAEGPLARCVGELAAYVQWRLRLPRAA